MNEQTKLPFTAEDPGPHPANRRESEGSSMTVREAKREWSQPELRCYLLAHGWKPEDFAEGETIPQGVKFIHFSPATAADVARAEQLLANGASS